MRSAQATTLADAYRDGLRAQLSHGKPAPRVTDPLSPASGFGDAPRPAVELLAKAAAAGDESRTRTRVRRRLRRKLQGWSK